MSSVSNDFVKKAGTVVGMLTASVLLILIFVASVKVFLLVFAGLMLAIFFRSVANWFSSLTSLSIKITLPVSVMLVLGLWVLLIFLLEPRVSRETDRMKEAIPAASQRLHDNLEESSVGRLVLKQLPFNLESPFSSSGEGQGSKGATQSSTPAEEGSRQASGEGTSSKQQGQNKEEAHFQDIRSRVISFFSTTLGILGNLYVVMFFGIFFMANPAPYKKGLLLLVPKKKRPRAEVIYDATGITLKSWLIGKIMSMLVVAVLSAIGLWIMGIPLFITLALFAGIMSFIPNFGPLIAIVPAFLVAYLEGPQQALLVVLLYMFIQAVESNIITPVIMKKQIEVPMAMTLFSQLLLGYLVGGWGLIFATPIVAAFMVLVQTIYIEDILGDKDLDVKGERLALKKHNEQ